jgi:hypothetical protein
MLSSYVRAFVVRRARWKRGEERLYQRQEVLSLSLIIEVAGLFIAFAPRLL